MYLGFYGPVSVFLVGWTMARCRRRRSCPVNSALHLSHRDTSPMLGVFSVSSASLRGFFFTGSLLDLFSSLQLSVFPFLLTGSEASYYVNKLGIYYTEFISSFILDVYFLDYLKEYKSAKYLGLFHSQPPFPRLLVPYTSERLRKAYTEEI